MEQASLKESTMASAALTRRSSLGAACVIAGSALFLPGHSHALCAAPAELGRWRNVAVGGEPLVIDLHIVGCGDQVLNGVQTDTAYQLRVWIRQSTGQIYGRPTVKASYRQWKGAQWLVGRVPTGGYVDNLWTRTEDKDGQRLLHVLIKHESLDSKPSATSEHWFRFEKRI
jgi:hypothetical protein